jgi:thioredoxin reductase (NADPH)
MDSLLTVIIAIVLICATVVPYVLKMRKKERIAHENLSQGPMVSGGPQGQHPHFDTSVCIGCGTCVSACPEGNVLAVISGKAMIVNGYKCVGHGLCAEACPVGAITIVMASPSASADLPTLSEHKETSVRGMFIAGELTGLALIKNAVNQGRDCIEYISKELLPKAKQLGSPDTVDVLIVGAGPAGISASLAAIERGMSYATMEQGDIGGTVRQYPRQKLVMTSPVELPMYGKFKKLEISKEALLEFWDDVFSKSGLQVKTQEKVLDIQKQDGIFQVRTTQSAYTARFVVLAIGKRGTPRKLGVPGEELEKVYYRLIEADHYQNNHILIVGGGDSAVEAAMGLAFQKGNVVTLSYRGESFSRLKDRNAKRLQEYMRDGKLAVLLNSNVKEITDTTVVLECSGSKQILQNDFVWIFAGGEPPNDFLKKIGVRFGAEAVERL